MDFKFLLSYGQRLISPYKSTLKTISIGLLIIIFNSHIFVYASTQHEHIEVVSSSDYTFDINVGGTIDPVNVEIDIENIGSHPVVNPKITVNGRYNWYTLKDLVEEITVGCNTDEEKVWAIFKFIRRESYWWDHPKDISAFNPVRHYNIYGYHICSMAAVHFTVLCRQAGIKARVWEIYHHTVAEIFWDGSWHLLDPDMGMWFLKDDNISIASMTDLEDHPEWVSRTFLPARSYILPGTQKRRIYRLESEQAGNVIANWYATRNNNYIANHYDKFAYEKYDMGLILRPGEKLVRWWTPKLRKHYDQKSTQEPPKYANGQIIFEPNFRKFTYRDSIDISNISYYKIDRILPAVHVKDFQNSFNDQPSRITIPMHSPYVMVGGYVESNYYKSGSTKFDKLLLEADFDPIFYNFNQLWSYQAIGTGNCFALLDYYLPRDGFQSTYAIDLSYILSVNSKHKNLNHEFPLIYGGQTGLDSIKIVIDLQINPNSLPALSLSKNIIRYTDDCNEDTQVKITYKWTEQHGNKPSAPKTAIFPKDGASIETSTPLFQWRSAHKPSAQKLHGYHFQLSRRNDCAWPLSPNFDREIYGKSSFQAPQGWLTPGRVYHWRVRAMNADGTMSPWSKVFSFSIGIPN